MHLSYFRSALLVLLAAVMGAVAPSADADEPLIEYNIPARDLSDALNQFATQSRLQLVYPPSLVANLSTSGLRARLSPDAALKQLLQGSDIEYEFVTANTLVLRRKSVGSSQVTSDSSLSQSSVQDGSGAAQHDSGGIQDVRLVQAETMRKADSASASAQDPNARHSSADAADQRSISEIVVTAQKREERLQEVPIPVTVVQSQTLVDHNELRLQDYAARIPGLTIVPSFGGAQNNVTIRGLSAGSNNPSVAFLVDDVPYGSGTAIAGGLYVPDLDPGDLARVEVLRGPQGTLYGASSLGGLIKYVTVDPSTESRSGRVSVGTTSVTNGDKLGYNLRGSVNVPLGDTLAMSVSGFSRMEPGFLDNDSLDIEGVNEQRVSGGRLSALWRPSSDWSLKLSALVQNHELHSTNDVGVALGEFQQNYPRDGSAIDKELQAYSANLTGALGPVELTSISGYNIERYRHRVDFSFATGSFPGATAAVIDNSGDIERFTQEVRLAVPLGGRVEALLGAFYTSEEGPSVLKIQGRDRASGALSALGYQSVSDYVADYSEYAVFANLTVQLTDRLDIQLGGRESWIDQSNQGTTVDSVFVTPAGTPVTTVGQTLRADYRAFTYLVTPRFKLSSDLMVYARIASGYRAGGINDATCGLRGFPCQYDPDETANYELGMKGDFLGGALAADLSLYYIAWKDIQLSLLDDPYQFTGNAGRARSQGIELSVESRPLDGLTIAGWAAWNDAVLTEDFPITSTAQGRKGDRLPRGAEWSGRLSVNQDFDLTGRLSGFVEGALSSVGERGGFIGSMDLDNYPAYTKFDVNAGARSSSGWLVNLFVTNITDKRATHFGNPVRGTVVYIQPRTIGINIGRHW